VPRGGPQGKRKGIRKRFSLGMEGALEALEKSLASGRLKDRYKMERRLGRIQARHRQVNDLFELTLQRRPACVLTTEQKSLLHQFGLDLPERLRLNRKFSVDPAAA
jgi:hypothetical protein